MENEQKKDPELEQNKKEQPLSTIMKVVITGFFGGVFWSYIGYCAYFFNFTDISPNMILSPWAVGEWKDSRLGNYISIFIIGLLSILIALVYYAVLRKMQSVWVGIIFGGALWALLFYVLNPIFPDLQTVGQLSRNTIITTVCLYVLYGVFIGYSISFEAAESERKQRTNALNE